MTSADVLTMPGVRLVAVQRLPLGRRAELLASLARRAFDLEPEMVTILVGSLAHDSLTGPDLQARWQSYMDRAAIADAADEGVFDWRVSCPELTCGNRTEVAAEVAHQDAVDALMVLAGGLP